MNDLKDWDWFGLNGLQTYQNGESSLRDRNGVAQDMICIGRLKLDKDPGLTPEQSHNASGLNPMKTL